jgi:hypothetical protein
LSLTGIWDWSLKNEDDSDESTSLFSSIVVLSFAVCSTSRALNDWMNGQTFLVFTSVIRCTLRTRVDCQVVMWLLSKKANSNCFHGMLMEEWENESDWLGLRVSFCFLLCERAIRLLIVTSPHLDAPSTVRGRQHAREWWCLARVAKPTIVRGFTNIGEHILNSLILISMIVMKRYLCLRMKQTHIFSLIMKTRDGISRSKPSQSRNKLSSHTILIDILGSFE